MIGAILIVVAMGLAVFGVAGQVFGVSDRPPLGLSLRVLGVICIALAALGVVLLRAGV